jgi:phosphoglycerate dehydrogenase-like enzyme
VKPTQLTIWCNGKFEEAAVALLRDGTRAHKLVLGGNAYSSVLTAGQSDPALAGADVAFGQPNEADCLRFSRLRWVHLSSAGYTRYDTAEFREGFRSRGAVLSNSSSVFAEPAAQHVLAMMLALGRQLLASYRQQTTDRSWLFLEHRSQSRLLTGQTVLLLGFGSIGRRLAELLAPFRCTIYAVRRQVRSERGVHVISEEDLTKVLPLADHVVNILPDNEGTRNWVNARRLACLKPGARFYNVGRGTTVDQNALIEALDSGRLGAAYLDVMEPEPLPPDHPLWSRPNCFITPHTAGGRHDQNEALVRLFLANLAAFERGDPLPDRVF